eukprot:7576892-Alexandrium_andersonii.AAC.1
MLALGNAQAPTVAADMASPTGERALAAALVNPLVDDLGTVAATVAPLIAARTHALIGELATVAATGVAT